MNPPSLNTSDFIRQCIQKAASHNTMVNDDGSSSSTDSYDLNSILHYDNPLEEVDHDSSSISCTTKYRTSVCNSETIDNDDLNTNQDDTNHDNMSDTSESDSSLNRDLLPKSFLQLKGISVANYNMGCNFHIAAALRIIMRYNLSILTIQEHSPWNKELSEGETTSISRLCDKWGYFATISKLQIIIVDKQLLACHRTSTAFEDGRIILYRFEISEKQSVSFISVYGVPHSASANIQKHNEIPSENTKLQIMTRLQSKLKALISKAHQDSDLLYIFGDLQDTPDNSKLFHYGPCRIAKHPLGIISTCEQQGLQCTIYQHTNLLEKPIVSRHGSKGGRFIDGMYTSTPGLANILGISIIHDTGISSDHDLVITKMDLGIEKYHINKEKEE